MYFFQRYDIKNDLPLGDETYIMILNTKCDPKLVPESLKPLFAYINDPSEIRDEFIRKLDNRVQQYNSKDWRGIQVTLEQMLLDKEKRDRAEAAASMKARVNALFDKLFELGRFDDAKRAAKDEEYQQKLFEEFGLE